MNLNRTNLVFILLLAIMVLISCKASTTTPEPEAEVVYGCMDYNSISYDSTATEDDGSCQYLGCTDSTSANFDPLANVDNGNCLDPSDIPAGWTLMWNDEFNGDSIDTGKWNHEEWWPGYVNNELQSYTKNPENSGVANGHLYLSARKENPFDPNNPAYNSARMNTARKVDWKYGRVEVRAKLPRGQGLWPAIWMMPTYSVYGGWPVSGEIDIMELLGHDNSRTYGTIHYGNHYPDKRSSGTSYVLPSGNFSDSFHTFAFEWEEHEMRWYVDDVLFQTLSSWFTIGGDYPAPFDQEFHLILNVAVGGEWPGNPDDTTLFPQTMLVDYVRLFQ
ncbi:MAG: glycoside hydrolase family 16 protein [Candidatus Marinimicrobia bacterium]|nr:glycoside hydrolase family 16 protein [Candidatus Neomarinimicrobiota bacterium]MBT3576583.1 glycoside hydrolase family 16 protein [Candidatus Neomarinimicrobiota bacterium]MBT3680189.1 glycoside hydrolase family 16 protein [Candidatus Neomarinimicrobiota bacterium]MBT3949836.1 glycoside hydrolase family 16 protein [Candidatus Neomarinimicrobiota bacterium]MBT4253558.1 glycoside hydrolase family 16 protein [Candidatus Neomarinimicrobiota bacterium]